VSDARKAPQEPPGVDVAKILTDLGRGRHVYHMKGEPRAQRVGAAIQLNAVLRLANLLMLPKDRPRYLAPLRHLLAALLDFEGQDSMLARLPLGHRPRLPAQAQVFRATAAAALDLLIRSGMPKPEAARLVARRIAPLVAGSSITATAISKWRENVADPKTRSSHGRDVYSLIVSKKASSPTAAAERAERLLRSLERKHAPAPKKS